MTGCMDTRPCYQGLKNNIPTKMMEMRLHPWKSGTESTVTHQLIKDYVQEISAECGVEPLIRYNTRVDEAKKVGGNWELRTTRLVDDVVGEGAPLGYSLRTAVWEFDFLVVASGHYHACNVPDIPGLSEWKRAFPDRISHSKRYRSPEGFENQTVLLLGAAVSSNDIAKEIAPLAKKVYQSSRGGAFDIPASMLPPNATRVSAISSFNPIPSSQEEPIQHSQAIPGIVTLANGETLTDIDRIIICTGYLCTYPFLKQYHNDSMPVDQSDDTVIITDGFQTHNLHKDIFYIPDPTLAFVGVPYHVATFTLYEFQSIVVAAVFSGKAHVPSEADMRAEYRARQVEKGHGRNFNSLKGRDPEYVNDMLEWINRDMGLEGDDRIKGHSDECLQLMKWFMENVLKKFGWDVSGESKSKAPAEIPAAGTEVPAVQ